MDKKLEEQKSSTENSMANSAIFSDEIPMNFSLSGIFDMPCDGDNKGSMGFMDLLGIHDFAPSSLFDLPLTTTSPSSTTMPMPTPPHHHQPLPSPAETSEVLNTTPTTPNSSSISSSSNEAAANIDEHTKPVQEEDAEHQDQDKTQKQ